MKIIKISIVSILVLMITFGIFNVFKKRTANNTETKSAELIVGTVANYAPFVSINENGDFEGFDIDVAKAVADKLGKKLIIRDLGSMAPLLIALDQGNINAAIWGLSITQDRLKKIAMVRYQGDTVNSFPMIFWKKPENIRDINDMNGMTICVEPASSQDTVLSNYDFIIKKQTERVDDALLNIQYGKADAAFVEPAIAKKFKSIYDNIEIINVPLEVENQVQGIGIAIKQTNIEQIEEIQKAVNALQKDGTLKKFEIKWGIA